MNNFYGYSFFHETPEPVKSFNRMVMCRNINETHGRDMAIDYLSNFQPHEHIKIHAMQIAERQNGLHNLKKEVVHGVRGS